MAKEAGPPRVIGDILRRNESKGMVLRQVGWLGQTGTFYPLGTTIDEPGGFSPVYIQIGCWRKVGKRRFAIDD